ncbi:MAG: hypothetical protein KDE46_01915 [Caldilineaceae bacterium]|nr:hypothetical protein [Caldilineaceae bacterium]
MNRKTKRVKLLLLAVTILCMLISACSPVSSSPSATLNEQPPEERETITLWTEWYDEILDELVAEYANNRSVDVEITHVPDLYNAILSAAASGTMPDTFIANSLLGEQLLYEGSLNAYCVGPDGCPECNTQDPPEWCLYAQGDDFSHGQFEDWWSPEVGYCVFDGCDECNTSNPPKWCLVADTIPPFDVLQWPFMCPVEGCQGCTNEWCPIGIPMDWIYGGAFGNKTILEENGIDIDSLTVMEDVWELRDLENAFAFSPNEATFALRYDRLWSDWQPVQGIPVFESLESIRHPISGEQVETNLVNPEDAAIVWATSHLVADHKELSLIPLHLADSQPRLWVNGIYMNPDIESERKSTTLDLMYYLADEEAQARIFESTGRLPAHAEVMEMIISGEIAGPISAEVVENLKDNGSTGVLYMSTDFKKEFLAIDE